MEYGVVAIGRNEGMRLAQCLESVSGSAAVVYVDLGSTDGSVQAARRSGADVVELDMRQPFTAARARNAGFRRLRELAPCLAYVQFIDGDCELDRNWPEHAIKFMSSHPDVSVVCGRLRERFPEKSVYNWLCDREWDRPMGEAHACAGNALFRATALESVGGYRDEVIAAEEDELCVRLRAAGWRIWRLGADMGLHDAGMTRFGQWWRRALRSGYAFAQGADLHGASEERHFVWESRRALLWGVGLPIVCAVICFWVPPWGLAAWLIYPLQAVRQAMRNDGSINQRATLAFFQVLGRFPEALGQIKFRYDRLLGRQAQLIEYK